MTKFGRRGWLRGAGGVALTLPWLESLGCGGASPTASVRHRAGQRPRRLISILVPNGTLYDEWFADDLGVLPPLLEPFADHVADMLLLKGVHNPVADTGQVDGHQEGTVSFLTGWGHLPNSAGPSRAAGPSLDHVLGSTLGVTTKLPTLTLGTENSGTLSAVSYDELGQPKPKFTSPYNLYSTLFGDPELGEEALDAVVNRRMSILDRVGEDYERVRSSVNGGDRQRLDAHLESIREVERQLGEGGACELDGSLDPFELPEIYEAAELPAWTRAMMDLSVLALSCDLSRYVTLVYRRPGGGKSYFPWLDLGGAPESFEHHDMTHDRANHVPQLRTIFRWFNEQTTYLLERLKATPDGEGTLFDSVALVQGSECSDGQIHDKLDMPLALFTGSELGLATGRVVDANGQPQNHLLVSLQNLMGRDGDVFGNPYYCSGPLEGLS